MYALVLAGYNAIFFWKFWKNPYLNHTSELATTFFPHWLWIGRRIRQGKLPLKDSIYYKFPAGIPFLSMFYPLHLVTAFIGSFLSRDNAFKLLNSLILIHYVVGSYIAYIMFRQWASPEAAIFGAITLFYSGYCIKIQQPCIAYTLCWIPGIFIHGWLGVLSMTMCLLGGYYPILIYLMPFLAVMYTKVVLLGCLFALPQLIPFLLYYFKSVRWKSDSPLSQGFGKVSLISLIEAILPLRRRTHTNGVMFMEMQMYMGLLPFIFMWGSHSRFWYVLIFGLAVVVGALKPWQRIPARALYIVTLAITVLSVDGLNKLGLPSQPLWLLVLMQAVMLLFNSDIYPCFPFTQWWTRPSEKDYDYTGYSKGVSLHEYRGAFSLR